MSADEVESQNDGSWQYLFCNQGESILLEAKRKFQGPADSELLADIDLSLEYFQEELAQI